MNMFKFGQNFFMRILEKLSNYYPHASDMKEFLLENTEWIKFEKGEIVSEQGSYNRNVYFVENGLLRSFYIEKGKEITTNFYTEGKLIAHLDTLFHSQLSRYNIQAIESSEILFCNYERLEEFCQTSIEAANFSRFILGKLMAEMHTRIASLQFMSAKEKYQHFLEENSEIVLRAPLGMIATYLGISQETLSRIRSEI